MPLVILSLFLMTLAIGGTFFLAYLRKIHPLGLPLLAGAIFFFVYVIQPAYLIWTGDIYYFLDNWQITKGVFVAFIMYLAFLKGWFSGIKKKIKINNNIIEKWNYKKLYRVGLGLSIFGTLLFLIFIYQSGGIYTFYSMPHGAAGAWREQTAYVYMGEYLVYPGIALLLLSSIRLNSAGRSTIINFKRLFPFFFFSFLLLIHAILTGDRGDFILLATNVGLSYFFATGKRPKTRGIIIGLCAIGIVILLLVGYRDYLHLGPKDKQPVPIKEALLSMISVSDSQIIRGVTGVEFIYHCGVIDAVDKLQRYHLGINWVYSLTVHLIPRIIWPDKPYGWNTPGVNPEEMASLFGWIRASGSAPGTVGDMYWQFGWMSLFFFYLIGLFSGYLFNGTMITKTPQWIIIYVLWYSWGYKLFAHGLGALLVPYFYVLLPTVFFMRKCYKIYKHPNVLKLMSVA
ncbi:MAG: oligosaccharide repeat unit polymerase [Candidatus Aenigmatarchaeota archaeon]